jgi:hypothetical protein
MSESERAAQAKVEAVTAIVTMLVTDDKLRARFLEDAPRTLEELGVQVKDQKRFTKVSEDLQGIVKQHISVYGSLIDPVGPVADVTIGAAVTTGVVTGASTAVAVGVVNWTDVIADPSQTNPPNWDVVELDFGRVRMLQRLKESELRIANLEVALAQERSQRAKKQR